MKKTLSIIILAAMLLTSLVIMPASADATAPTGQIWEAEMELRSNYTTTGGDWYGQEKSAWNTNALSELPSHNGMAFWKNTVKDAELTIKLDVKTSGLKTFYAQVFVAKDFGIFDIYFDDTLIADNLDLWHYNYIAQGTEGYNDKGIFVEKNLGQYNVTAGEHTLKIVAVDKNAATGTNYYFGLDYFEMVGEDNVRRYYNAENGGESYGTSEIREDGTIRYEAEAMTVSDETKAKSYTYDAQAWSGNDAQISFAKLLRWQKTKDNETFTVSFDVASAGDYNVMFHALAAKTFGKMSISIDGNVVVPELDLYDTSSGASKYVSLDDKITLAVGTHTLTLTSIGQNAAMEGTNRRLALDYIELTPVTPEPVVPPTPPTSDGIVIVFVGVTAALVGVISVSALLRKKVNAK